jgi:3beta-hydroxy-delta5-steroid dehydrogenase/steroid delta-isomerase
VWVFDLRPLSPPLPGVAEVTGDVRSLEDLRKAMSGVDTVFHTVAVLDFARFASAERRERAFAVNVRGVENVVRAAREAGAARLVHTSTNNVTLDGPVIDGDESRPYALAAKDLYTVTKIQGERIALAASGERLLTCAIRPGGIYGPGDPLMFPRLCRQLAKGRYRATIGRGDALSDNTFIANLVDGHIEAARHLLPGSPLAGQAYFITDCQPINYFDFFRPWIEALGYAHPRVRIPAGPLIAGATAWEWIHARVGGPAPALLAMEVRKMVVSHYSRCDKARRDFGWTPKISPAQAFGPCLAYCRELLRDTEIVDRPHWLWWIAILGGMAATGALAISATAYAWWSARVTPWIPRAAIGAVFVWACGLHAWKGLRAVRLAERAGLRETSLAWGWQTLLLGFASLRLLERRAARRGASPRA